MGKREWVSQNMNRDKIDRELLLMNINLESCKNEFVIKLHKIMNLEKISKKYAKLNYEKIMKLLTK